MTHKIPYTTVELWFYQYVSVDTAAHATHILVDEFATRKGHHYATIVLDAETGRLLSIVPGRDISAITAALQGVLGDVCSVVSDFAPAQLLVSSRMQRIYWIVFISSSSSQMLFAAGVVF